MAATLQSFTRHKWKFVIITVLFWAAAAASYFLTDPPYVSEAKLLVRYVIDSDGPSGLPELEAHNAIMKTEIEILTSRDLAERVVKEIGADRLSKGGGEAEAESVLSGGLMVGNEKESAVIRITFRHADPETAHTTLEALMESYFAWHMQIHRTAKATASARAELLESLALMGSAGVFSKTRADFEAEIIPGNQIPNIATIQTPTPAVPDLTRRNQIFMGLVAGGPVIGLLVVLVLGMLGIPRKDQFG